jgi:hypothetical protein
MTRLFAIVLSSASCFVLSAGGQTAAPAGARLAPDREVRLTPEELLLVRKGEVVLRELASAGSKGRTYEAIGRIGGSLDEAASVLADFESYPDFMPNVSAVKVRERTGPSAVVEISLRLPLGMKRQYRLNYTAVRDEAGFTLDWHQMPWPELKPSHAIADTSGYWFVRGFEDGGLLVVYHVYTDPGRVPLGLTGIARGLAKHKITGGIEELRERVRKIFQPGVR